MIVGFVGLGNMGSALAENLVACGLDVVTHDVAGPERAPAGAAFVRDLASLAASADVVVLSLPDGRAVQHVTEGLRAAGGAVRQVIDTSTVGVAASREIAALLDVVDIGYLDAPVSGGPAGARARTLTVMYSGTDDTCAATQAVLEALSDRRIRVGDQAGMAQAVKLANNFLAATALAATSEALAFGQRAGVDLAVMLEVLATSSGQNIAVNDKFPNHVLSGTYASGFSNTLMAKDLRLYLESAAGDAAPPELGALVEDMWRCFATAEPGVDFTRIFPFLGGRDA